MYRSRTMIQDPSGGPTPASSNRRKPRQHGRKNRWHNSSTNKPRICDRDRPNRTPYNPAREMARIPRGRTDKLEEKPELDNKELETKLHVKGIDLNIAENTREHHTDEYECTQDREVDGKNETAELVIRRGQDFKMTIEFDRPYDIKKNDITLSFNLEEDRPRSRLSATFKVKDDDDAKANYKPRKWGATVAGKEGNTLTLNIFVPATVPVGEWEFSIRTKVDVEHGKDLYIQYNHTADYIKILFNPWCKEDMTYLEDDKWRVEAVLNDSGAVYNGSFRKIGVKPWFFGQFEEGILDTSIELLQKAFNGKMCAAMASPAAVARAISAIVNAPDDGGVLVGNWSGSYAGGAKPTSWCGSVKILQKYTKDKCKPVRYGQCWVFSAVVTTVCRALGLPCRSVTNHSSAHNTDLEKLSIDIVTKKDANGDWVDIKSDSVWNFHVWNEVWYQTPDLNTDDIKYDGWQVIDATPQEKSDGLFQCGPAPVKAVREGHLRVGKDTAFVYAEVNADKVNWKENQESGKLFEKKRSKNIVGKTISTHEPTGEPYNTSTMGRFLGFFGVGDHLERLDLTEFYKYPEGSEEERKVNRKAEKLFRQMNGCDYDSDSEHECEEEEPVDIEIEEMEEEVFVGEKFGFNVTVKNRTKEIRTMNLALKIYYKTYYDSICGLCEEEKFTDVKMKPGEVEKFKIVVDEDKAVRRPQDGFNFEVKAIAEFKENDHVVTEDYDFRLRRPDLDVDGPSSCKSDETIEVEVKFENPLNQRLTKCEIDLEGKFQYVEGTRDHFTVPNIDPKGTLKTTLRLKPSKKGKTIRHLNIGFDSKQLSDIGGKYQVKVK